jgi:hypothetical protein
MYVDGVKASTTGDVSQGEFAPHLVIGNGDMYDTSMQLSDRYGWEVDIDELFIAKSAWYTKSFTPRNKPL